VAILADFECTKCGTVSEELCHGKQKKSTCPDCGKASKRIISFGKVYTGNQSAPWLPSVLEVVDKTNKAPHVQNFVKNPTRENYKAWMKGEGIRPADHSVHGGPPVYTPPKRSESERQQLVKELYEKHRARKAVNVNL
jgi:putative FmdB family regulatory protein